MQAGALALPALPTQSLDLAERRAHGMIRPILLYMADGEAAAIARTLPG